MPEASTLNVVDTSQPASVSVLRETHLVRQQPPSLWAHVSNIERLVLVVPGTSSTKPMCKAWTKVVNDAAENH